MKQAFTLLELAVVLVIIGLLVGGVLVGRDLIHSAEMMTIQKEKKKIEEAILTFRLKYNCLPGDCSKATRFFGSAGGDSTMGGGPCRANASVNKGTTGSCNGDGNGKISESGSMGESADPDWGNERFLMWQHLALAGYIEGNYAPTGDGISYGHHAGYNVPQSKSAENAGWAILRVDNAADAANIQSGPPDGVSSTLIGKHGLMYAAMQQASSGNYYLSPRGALLPEEALSIDQKYDDGMPYTGNITATPRPSNPGPWCTYMPQESTSPTAIYTTTGGHSTKKGCILIFPLTL